MATAAERKAIPKPAEEKPSLESEALDAKMRALLSEKDFKLIQMIAVAVGKDGMTVEEACILTHIDYSYLQELAKQHPSILTMIRFKELEYKRSLLKTLSHRARSGDDDVAQWLLETRYPDEFGKKKQGGDGSGRDALSEAIAFIQESGDSTGIISRKALVIAPQRAANATPLIKRLQGFLS